MGVQGAAPPAPPILKSPNHSTTKSRSKRIDYLLIVLPIETLATAHTPHDEAVDLTEEVVHVAIAEDHDPRGRGTARTRRR